MNLEIYKETEIRIPRKKLEKLFGDVAKKELKSDAKGKVNLIFTSDKRIKDLNRQYRKIDKPTDVLSFNIDLPDTEDSIMGEIYISVPFAVKQARSYGENITEEILRLVCHGLLHLCGYDHQKEKDELLMKRLENFYLGLN
ncbi:MAG: rRNA maturation RNase YbeY [FCB group bacterium]|nr:rRNA maturation RNase YbeY [FCB group bacterium]